MEAAARGLSSNASSTSTASQGIAAKIERRTAARPWSKGAAARQAPAKSSEPVAATGTDAEWKEF
jgi:hypothetical protein